ncbi:Dps family protein [Paenibacillus mucilaginosus]|uniref:Starvation-induced protein controlled by sigma-B (General stress protein 20U) n=1 Tax=Paenibacillus mucilaginosus (strain KNP414) TaxID=1036673 RepID=F8FP09_PAEMK|nr:Dps family protein [Paenibacillus mucilaginosus]AEI45788.1 starvation-induced protein controlled by sigma-B (general stress protein 20U) [Paenibacillus mucilaginosus KNP414]WDM27163.1 DNA starvation/stationary phase protection protein [Paenibacillus mucilaginosus]
MAKVLEKDKELKEKASEKVSSEKASSEKASKESSSSRSSSKSGQDSELLSLLNQQIANWAVLHMKIHQHHWYVKGPNFFPLHVKFQELYEEASLTLDELAERLLAVGGQPVSTSKEIARAATIEEHEPLETAEEMVRSLRDDYKQLIEETGEAMELAEEEKDEGTHDMLLELKTKLEKHVWMLNAHLGREVE